jgi:hypothetical protein
MWDPKLRPEDYQKHLKKEKPIVPANITILTTVHSPDQAKEKVRILKCNG